MLIANHGGYLSISLLGYSVTRCSMLTRTSSSFLSVQGNVALAVFRIQWCDMGRLRAPAVDVHHCKASCHMTHVSDLSGQLAAVIHPKDSETPSPPFILGSGMGAISHLSVWRPFRANEGTFFPFVMTRPAIRQSMTATCRLATHFDDCSFPVCLYMHRSSGANLSLLWRHLATT